jgi:hypothetical protein
MKTIYKVCLAAAALAVLIAGCTAASHIKALQPAAPPKSPPLRVPVVRPAVQLGVDIDAYTYPGQDVAKAAQQDIGYIANLHANAVMISFPFFMDGPDSVSVHATAATPTPAQLAVIVQDAAQAGLYVAIRPLLDETSLGTARTGWSPARKSAWFASYRTFLLPYAAAAQANHVQEFIVGAEFSRFARSRYWNLLDAALRRVYTGTLAFANNWGGTFLVGAGGNVAETVDAYHPLSPPLLAGWEAFDRALPAGTVETEVGIAAVSGAYRAPYRHSWPVSVLDPAMQATWFSDACRAALATHLGGIYFWAIGLGDPSGPTLADQGAWAHSAGAAAIAQCFAQEVPS